MRVITGYLGAGQTTMARSMDGALPPGYDRVWLKKEYGACLLCTRELAGEVQVVALWRRPSQLGVAPAYGAPAGGVTRGAGSHTPSDAESWHVLPAAGREGWLCPSVGSQPAPRSRARRRAARAARRRARVGPWIPPPNPAWPSGQGVQSGQVPRAREWARSPPASSRVQISHARLYSGAAHCRAVPESGRFPAWLARGC